MLLSGPLDTPRADEDACLTCMPYLHALPACLTCMPYLHALPQADEAAQSILGYKRSLALARASNLECKQVRSIQAL